mmetsp:Transcript_103525/g.259554  ORF Transcript_103525/g.259554 Transcript_103525/m.259554 type:complete len:220 (+) Transcript_103525:902-1561(+)
MGRSDRPRRSATKRPVSISESTKPSAQQSSPGACCNPWAASGDMYGMFSLLVTADSLLTYSAQPKSTSTARPVRSLTSTFSDQTSRCTSPVWCINDRASASCGSTCDASVGDEPQRRKTFDSGSESAMYSMAMHTCGGSPATCGTRCQLASTSTSCTMCGWGPRSRMICTSRHTRASSLPVSRTNFSEITFTAILRPRFCRSWTSKTTPRFPEPIFTAP